MYLLIFSSYSVLLYPSDPNYTHHQHHCQFNSQPPIWSATRSNIAAVDDPFTTTYSHNIWTGGTPKGWQWFKSDWVYGYSVQDNKWLSLFWKQQYNFFLIDRKQKHKVNYRLISPAVANSRFLPHSWREYIDYTDDKAIAGSAPEDNDREIDDEKHITSEDKVIFYVVP